MPVALPWPPIGHPAVAIRPCSDRAATAQELSNFFHHIVACIAIDGLVVAEREGTLHNVGRVLEVTVDPMRVELDRGLARDVPANNWPRFDIRRFEYISQRADLERCVVAHLDREAEPSVFALRRLVLEIEDVAVLRQLAPEPGGILAPCLDVTAKLGKLHKSHGALQLGRTQVVAEIDEQEARVDLRVALEPALAVLDFANPAVRA